MNKSKYFGFERKSIILFSIMISLLFISSATAVPQVNGSIAIDKIDELNQNEILIDLISKNFDFNKKEYESTTINELYIFTQIIGLEIDMIVSSNYNTDLINTVSEIGQNNVIDEKVVIIETKECISSLSNNINIIQNDNELNNKEYDSLNIIKGYLLKIDNVFTNKFYNNENINKDSYLLLDNGAFQNIISIILTVLQFIITILKALLQGFFTLFGGLIKTIGAIIGIIVLILADIQTILLLAGLYIISLGVLSKNIIKTLASIGAPIFAAISAFLSIALGSLLGSIFAVGLSIIGVLIILAIPIALVAAFLYFSGYFDQGDGDGLLYIIASCIAYYMKTI